MKFSIYGIPWRQLIGSFCFHFYKEMSNYSANQSDNLSMEVLLLYSKSKNYSTEIWYFSEHHLLPKYFYTLGHNKQTLQRPKSIYFTLLIFHSPHHEIHTGSIGLTTQF